MPTSYVLSPNPVLQLTDNVGKYVPYGKILTLDWETRDPKPTYFDPGGQKPRANPFHLDSTGRAFEVFWEDDRAYYLELQDKYGNVIWSTSEPFLPGGGGGSNVTTAIEFENLFINGQMRYFPIGVYEPIPDSIPILAYGGWSYLKNGTNPTAKLAFKKFTPDNTDAPASPVYYLEYFALNPGSNETRNEIIFTIQDVRTLANEEISIAFYGRSVLSGTYDIHVVAIQHFGSAGGGVTPSADVETPIFTVAPTTAGGTVANTSPVILPSLTGKTIGINGDDALKIAFRMPPNQNAHLELTNFYLKRGSKVIDYPYETADEVDATVKALRLPEARPYTDVITPLIPLPTEEAYNAITLRPENGTLTQAWMPTIPIGSVLLWPSNVTPDGYIEAKGQELLQAGMYNRLYNVPFSGGKKFGNAYGTVSDNINVAVGWEQNTFNFTVFSTKQGLVKSAWTIGNTPFTIVRNVINHGDAHIALLSESGNESTYRNTVVGAVGTAVITNSGLSIQIISNGSPTTEAEWKLTAAPGSVIVAGSYLAWETPLGNYYIWFKKDGAGTNPNLMGYADNWEVNISSNHITAEIQQIINLALRGSETNTFTAVAASSLKPADYFEISTTSTDYAPYYRIDGSTDVPSVPGRTLVPIDIASTDNPEEVALKTFDALNPLLWKMPDWRGYFPRFWNDGATIDPGAASRTDRGDGTTGDNPGTYQGDDNKSHVHALSDNSGLLQVGGGTTQVENGTFYQLREATVTMGTSGGAESRPKNVYFSAIVKY